MSSFFKILLVGVAIYAALHINRSGLFEKNIAATLAADNEVVMYSLTTCPYCKEKRQWMTRVGIPFREYFVDADDARRQEFENLLVTHYVAPGGIGLPSLLVNGNLLVNNPEREEVTRRLKYRQ
jgi:glutaredoxin